MIKYNTIINRYKKYDIDNIKDFENDFVFIDRYGNINFISYTHYSRNKKEIYNLLQDITITTIDKLNKKLAPYKLICNLVFCNNKTYFYKIISINEYMFLINTKKSIILKYNLE